MKQKQPKPKQLADITGDIGPLYNAWKSINGAPKIPMYSYDGPAYMLWQAVYDGMRDAGATHEQAIEWLQSSSPRYALDGDLGDQLRIIGWSLGRRSFGKGA